MSKKSIIGLILFGLIITSSLFIGVNYMISKEYNIIANDDPNYNIDTEDNNVNGNKENSVNKQSDTNNDKQTELKSSTNEIAEITQEEPWLEANPSELGLGDKVDISQNTELKDTISNSEGSSADNNASSSNDDINDGSSTDDVVLSDIKNTLGSFVRNDIDIELIYDSTKVDYKSYIPEIICDSKVEAALDIVNPSISISASAAILIDANTKEVLFYKNAIEPVFPASTVKLLTALVVLDWCKEEDVITVGDEVNMMASDSTRAYLCKGQKLTVKSLLEAMLLPSGNDAAYVAAVHVGRKSLQLNGATQEEAVKEFSRLMNKKAKELGALNSYFLTPDGYDAIGQYTTTYDMGMIGLAAVKNKTVLDVSGKSRSRNILLSGEDITWNNTNALINKGSGRYYSYAIGLKTGTSTMAGRCIVAAGRKDGKEVVCVIMNSTPDGRWNDATTLLKYGLQ